MNFTDYINKDDLRPLKIGSVLLEEGEFKYVFKVERDPFTDAKFSQLYISVSVNDRTFKFIPDDSGVLFGIRSLRKSVFKISPAIIEKLNSAYEDSIIRQIEKYM